MSWLAPSALALGAIAALVIGALHFITRSEPRPEQFPTARFIPERALRARARTLALSDLALLALRAAAVLCLAAAVAGPLHGAVRGRVLRVVALDRSRAVSSAREVADSVRALLREGDVVIAFDTGATLVPAMRATDSVPLSSAQGSLSTALAAAIGIAARAADRADSIELVLVSPFAADEADDATLRIRETAWPGRIRLVRVGAAPVRPFNGGVESAAPLDDPVGAAIALAGLRAAGGSVRLARTTPSPADSAWARTAGHVLVHWPTGPDAAFTRRAVADTVGGVVAGDAVFVARLARLWVVEGPAIARWVDGEAAAVEREHGDGCIRDVAIPLDAASDATLRPAFRRFLGALLAPCGGARSGFALTNGALSRLRGSGALAPAASLGPSRQASSWTPWLLALGALLLIAELGARRARASAS